MHEPCKTCSKKAYDIVKKNINLFKGEPYFIEDNSIKSRFINCLLLGNYLEYFNYIIVYDASSVDKLILFNNMELCNKCRALFVLYDDLKKIKYRYILDSIKTYQYNLLVNEYLPQLHDIFDGLLQRNTLYSIESNIIKLKNSINYLRLNPPTYSIYWRGADWYYLKIFKIPRILENLRNYNLREHYFWRHKNFCDSICGHPKASHGWLHDSIENMKEEGFILY